MCLSLKTKGALDWFLTGGDIFLPSEVKKQTAKEVNKSSFLQSIHFTNYFFKDPCVSSEICQIKSFKLVKPSWEKAIVQL